MTAMEKHDVETPNCKHLTVHIQGDLAKIETKAVFLTFHDMGCNHSSWSEFVSHPVMRETRDRSIFIHIDAPGQEDNAHDLSTDCSYPTMQQIAEDIISVLDHFKIPLVVCLGEGAGANILVRFGMLHPDRCHGLILVHCTASTAGVMEHFKEKIMNWKLSSVGMNPSTEQYLIFHKYGHQMDSAENKERLIKEYQDKLQTKINSKNLKKYVDAFLKRTDLTSKLENHLKVETLLITGSKASHVQEVHIMHQACNKLKASLLKVDDVGDILVECPDKFAQSLSLFCKGLGLLTSLPMTGIDRRGGFRKQRTMSMEEYDTPNLRRFSFSSSTQITN